MFKWFKKQELPKQPIIEEDLEAINAQEQTEFEQTVQNVLETLDRCRDIYLHSPSKRGAVVSLFLKGYNIVPEAIYDKLDRIAADQMELQLKAIAYKNRDHAIINGVGEALERNTFI